MSFNTKEIFKKLNACDKRLDIILKENEGIHAETEKFKKQAQKIMACQIDLVLEIEKEI
jgi:sulfur transfer protein SufE